MIIKTIRGIVGLMYGGVRSLWPTQPTRIPPTHAFLRVHTCVRLHGPRARQEETDGRTAAWMDGRTDGRSHTCRMHACVRIHPYTCARRMCEWQMMHTVILAAAGDTLRNLGRSSEERRQRNEEIHGCATTPLSASSQPQPLPLPLPQLPLPQLPLPWFGISLVLRYLHLRPSVTSDLQSRIDQYYRSEFPSIRSNPKIFVAGSHVVLHRHTRNMGACTPGSAGTSGLCMAVCTV